MGVQDRDYMHERSRAREQSSNKIPVRPDRVGPPDLLFLLKGGSGQVLLFLFGLLLGYLIYRF